jgi:hypothetical protein
MAKFSSALLFDLAKYADKNGQFLSKEAQRVPGVFKKCDEPKIDSFIHGVFMVLMLRAAKFAKMAEDAGVAQKDMVALTHFNMLLFSDSVHPDETSDVENTKMRVFGDKGLSGANGLIEKFGPIPVRTDRSDFDDDLSKEILAAFDNLGLALACK